VAKQGCKQPPTHMAPIQAGKSYQKVVGLGHPEDRLTAQKHPSQGSWQAWQGWAAPGPTHSYVCRQPELCSVGVPVPHDVGPHPMCLPTTLPHGHLWPFLPDTIFAPLAVQLGHPDPVSVLYLGSRRRRAALVPNPRAACSGLGQGQYQNWPQNPPHRKHHILLDASLGQGGSSAQNTPGVQALNWGTPVAKEELDWRQADPGTSGAVEWPRPLEERR
jgi:hypothetical protein